MELRKITAIIRNGVLKDVGEQLKELGIKGITVSRIKGYGEHANLLADDWLCDTHSRIEIFASHDQVNAIASAIMESAHTGLAGDGMIAVLPVEEIFRIKTKATVLPSEI
jgi:nitrogen regulatory protein P-II 1